MGEMRIMGKQGDVKVQWDPNNSESVEKAEKEFDALREAGFEAYTDGLGTKKRRVKKFSPKAAVYVMAPGARTKVEKQAAQTTGRRAARPKAMAGGPNDRLVRL